MDNKKKTAVSTLFLTAGILFLAAGVFFWIQSAGNASSSDKEPWCVVEVQGVEELGKTYEGYQAEDGYSFYRVSYLVTNTGDSEAYRPLPSMYYEGVGYDDVYDHYYWESEEETWNEEETPLFDGDYDACIPPGRTGKAEEVLMIKQGIIWIQASYYPGYSDEELYVEISVP